MEQDGYCQKGVLLPDQPFHSPSARDNSFAWSFFVYAYWWFMVGGFCSTPTGIYWRQQGNPGSREHPTMLFLKSPESFFLPKSFNACLLRHCTNTLVIRGRAL